MSSVYVLLALVAAFGAVLLGGVAVQTTLGERRRTMTLLERQAEPSANLRERNLAEPFVTRVAGPTGVWLKRAGLRLTPVGMRSRIERKLVLAGNPAAWDAEKVAALKIVGGVGGLVFGTAVATAAHRTGAQFVTAAAVLGAVGWLLPGAALGQKAVARQTAIRKALADTMDLLVISVEAGLGFDAAMAQVASSVPGPLSEEIGRTLHEVQLGVGRTQALRHLAERTDVEELHSFAMAMVQADTFGVSIGNVLRAQAKELRIKRRQRAEGQAMKTPVKLVFPLIFCILPALLAVVAGPGVIRITQAFFH